MNDFLKYIDDNNLLKDSNNLKIRFDFNDFESIDIGGGIYLPCVKSEIGDVTGKIYYEYRDELNLPSYSGSEPFSFTGSREIYLWGGLKNKNESFHTNAYIEIENSVNIFTGKAFSFLINGGLIKKDLVNNSVYDLPFKNKEVIFNLEDCGFEIGINSVNNLFVSITDAESKKTVTLDEYSFSENIWMVSLENRSLNIHRYDPISETYQSRNFYLSTPFELSGIGKIASNSIYNQKVLSSGLCNDESSSIYLKDFVFASEKISEENFNSFAKLIISDLQQVETTQSFQYISGQTGTTQSYQFNSDSFPVDLFSGYNLTTGQKEYKYNVLLTGQVSSGEIIYTECSSENGFLIPSISEISQTGITGFSIQEGLPSDYFDKEEIEVASHYYFNNIYLSGTLFQTLDDVWEYDGYFNGRPSYKANISSLYFNMFWDNEKWVIEREYDSYLLYTKEEDVFFPQIGRSSFSGPNENFEPVKVYTSEVWIKAATFNQKNIYIYLNTINEDDYLLFYDSGNWKISGSYFNRVIYEKNQDVEYPFLGSEYFYSTTPNEYPVLRRGQYSFLFDIVTIGGVKTQNFDLDETIFSGETYLFRGCFTGHGEESEIFENTYSIKFSLTDGSFNQIFAEKDPINTGDCFEQYFVAERDFNQFFAETYTSFLYEAANYANYTGFEILNVRDRVLVESFDYQYTGIWNKVGVLNGKPYYNYKNETVDLIIYWNVTPLRWEVLDTIEESVVFIREENVEFPYIEPGLFYKTNSDSKIKISNYRDFVKLKKKDLITEQEFKVYYESGTDIKNIEDNFSSNQYLSEEVFISSTGLQIINTNNFNILPSNTFFLGAAFDGDFVEIHSGIKDSNISLEKLESVYGFGESFKTEKNQEDIYLFLNGQKLIDGSGSLYEIYDSGEFLYWEKNIDKDFYITGSEVVLNKELDGQIDKSLMLSQIDIKSGNCNEYIIDDLNTNEKVFLSNSLSEILDGEWFLSGQINGRNAYVFEYQDQFEDVVFVMKWDVSILAWIIERVSDQLVSHYYYNDVTYPFDGSPSIFTGIFGDNPEATQGTVYPTIKDIVLNGGEWIFLNGIKLTEGIDYQINNSYFYGLGETVYTTGILEYCDKIGTIYKTGFYSNDKSVFNYTGESGKFLNTIYFINGLRINREDFVYYDKNTSLLDEGKGVFNPESNFLFNFSERF